MTGLDRTRRRFPKARRSPKLSVTVGRYKGGERPPPLTLSSLVRKILLLRQTGFVLACPAVSLSARVRQNTHTCAGRYGHLHASPPAAGSRNITFSLFTTNVNSRASSLLYDARRRGERTQRIKMSLLSDARRRELNNPVLAEDLCRISETPRVEICRGKGVR